MKTKTMNMRALCVVAVAATAFVVSGLGVMAQLPGATSEPQEITLTGRVVDLHCFMTGKMPSSDPVQCTADCIRAGVPAALQTRDNLVVLGQGTRGASKAVLGFAYQQVEVRGKLFEKHGLKYLDIETVQKAPVAQEN